MRVFIGISFNDDIKDQLTIIENKIRNNSSKGNFTLRNNLHLTLRYIGEVNSKELFTLKNIVSKIGSNYSCFSFRVEDLGEFKRGKSSIVFAGVEKNKELSDLYTLLDKELKEKGFELDNKPYTPHITLGREVVYNADFNIKSITYIPIDVNVEKITLFESTRVKGVLTYLPIIEVKLK